MTNIINNVVKQLKSEDLNALSFYKDNFYIDNLVEKDKQNLIKRGEKWLSKEFPPLPFSLYREYKLTGNRVNFQTIVDNRRFALNDVFFAELVENKSRFIDLIIEFLYETFSEIVWWLPAHNVYQRDGFNSGYPDSTNPIIALFCAETAAQVSIIVNTFKDRLPNELINIANKELEERIFIPFEESEFWWMAKDGDFVNNWAPWCTQNVLLSYAFSPSFDHSRMLKFMNKSSIILDCFFNSYGEDGCCEEGPQYYHVAGGTLFGSLEIINLCSNNKINEIFKNEKLNNIASYIKKVHISGPYYVNFGDSNAKAGSCNAKDYLFAKRVDNKELMDFISKYWIEVEDKLSINERNLFDRYIALRYFDEIEKLSKEMKNKDVEYSTFTQFKSKGLYIFKYDNNTLAVQAGSNNMSHNHNDTGSFIYYKKGKPLFIDVGVEEYSEKSFSKDRYKIWTMRSTYHNLSNFEDCEQIDGVNTACEILNLKDNEITMQLKNTYKENPKLLSYIRTLRIEENNLILEDKVDTSLNIQMSLLVQNSIVINSDNSFNIGKERIRYEGDIKDIKVEPIPIKDSRLKVSLPNEIYRVLIKYNNNIKLYI